MEPLGIALMLSLLAAALWGVWVAVTIISSERGATLWLKGSVTLIVSCLVVWMLDSQSFGEVMRRSLRLLDVGLIIAMGDGIARATHWIDEHAGYPFPAGSRRREVRAAVRKPQANISRGQA